WIQALTGTRRGVATGGGTPILDTPFNGGGSAFTSQSNLTPFYDPLGAAGTYGTNNAYFLDTPLVNENEYETNPVAAIQFQVILADDMQTTVEGITQHDLTLYGGEWWGFTYSATDVPEPASSATLCLAATLMNRRRKRAA